MAKCVANFQAGDLKKLRTGRAHPSLATRKVDYDGSDRCRLHCRARARWSSRPGRVQPIEKAIFKSDLGLTPMTHRHRHPRADAGLTPPRHHPRCCATMPKGRRAQRAARCHERHQGGAQGELISQDDESVPRPRCRACRQARGRHRDAAGCQGRGHAGVRRQARPSFPATSASPWMATVAGRPLAAARARPVTRAGRAPVHPGVQRARHRGSRCSPLERDRRGRRPRSAASWDCSWMLWTPRSPELHQRNVRMRFIVMAHFRAPEARLRSAQQRPC